jgi:two-component system, NtrC family, response regulator AtoC
MANPRVLVVDDDAGIRRYLGALLPSLGYQMVEASSGEQALEQLRARSAPALVLLDLLMPGMGGLEVLDRLRRDHAQIPVVVLSTEAQRRTVVEAVRRGASNYLTKPFEDRDLESALQRALDEPVPAAEARVLKTHVDEGDPGLVSSNPRMLLIKEVARRVADTDAPVLLLGESGVGKEVVARYVHGQSQRARQPFVKVNCAALPEDLLESELFGYERGAFSGALREKPGLFELADEGSILLDEIGEMTPHLQAKLLHVLQDGEFTRLGGRQAVRVDARVMAATNVCLEEAVASGRFREDLYFRLNVIRLDIPPLRERRDDIGMLCAFFLRRYAARYRTTLREMPSELREAFLRSDWPGNVRELENAVRRYVILPDVEMALSSLKRRPEPEPEARPEASPSEDLSLREAGAQAAEEAERVMVRRALAETRWNRKEAAGLLRISYKALLNKLKKWDLQGGEPAARPTRHADAGAALSVPCLEQALAASGSR